MRNVWKIAVGLYLVAQVLFLINIQFPTKLDFDEFHYVPAAKEFVQFQKIPNREHPPLAKMIIDAGIQLMGDRPIGWRVMSTVFGSLTLVGMFYWGLALFRDEKIALWIAVVTLANQLLYVQARIAMLDTFMFAFMAWAFAAFTATWWTDLPEEKVRRRLLASGILFALATACKWFGVIGLFTCIGMVFVVYMFNLWGVTFQAPDSKHPFKIHDWYSPGLWKGITLQDWVMYMGIIPAVVYFITFIPYSFFAQNPVPIWKIFSFQLTMYGDQLRVVGTHPYMSTWTQWPLMSRPIWYAFNSVPGGFRRCVMLLGNPLVMWGGLGGLLVCLYGFARDRSREAFLILSFYIGMLGSWVFIPRKLEFFYYYYPAGMVLSLALAYPFFVLDQAKKKPWVQWTKWGVLACTVGMFIYFFPIISAIKIPAESFRRYMWLRSWI